MAARTIPIFRAEEAAEQFEIRLKFLDLAVNVFLHEQRSGQENGGDEERDQKRLHSIDSFRTADLDL